jgi:hypothetical protein
MPIDNINQALSSGLLDITRYDTRSGVGDAPEIRVAKRRSPGIPRAGASFCPAAKLARFLRIEQENLSVKLAFRLALKPGEAAKIRTAMRCGLDSGLAIRYQMHSNISDGRSG